MHFTKHKSGIRIHHTPWLTAVFAPLAAAYLIFAFWDLYRESELDVLRAGLLGSAALAFCWAFATLRLVSVVHFDRRSQSVRWRHMSLLRRRQWEVPFDQIERVGLVVPRPKRPDLKNLVVFTKSGQTMTVADRLSAQVDHDVNLFREIRELLSEY